MERVFSQQQPIRIAIEVGGHSRWISRVLRSYGHKVVVTNARKLRLIYENPRKRDPVDAESIWPSCFDASLLSPVIQRGEHAQHLAILRSRGQPGTDQNTIAGPCT